MKTFDYLQQLLKKCDNRERKAILASFMKGKNGGEEIMGMLTEIAAQEDPEPVIIQQKFQHLLHSNPSKFFGDIYDKVMHALALVLHKGITPMMEFEVKANILLYKRLYAHVGDQVVKATKFGAEAEYFSEARRLLLFIEAMIENHIFNIGDVPGDFDYVGIAAAFWEKEANLELYRQLHSEVVRAGKIPVMQDRLVVLSKLEGNNLLTNISLCKSKRASIFFLRCKYSIAYFSNDFGSAVDSINAMISVYENYPHLLKDPAQYSYYLACQMGLGICYRLAGHPDKALDQSAKMEQFVHQNATFGSEAYERFSFLRLHNALYIKADGLNDLIAEITTKLKSSIQALKTDTVVSIIWYLGMHFLFLKRPDKAIRLLISIVIAQTVPGRIPVKKNCLLVFLLAHLQAGNRDVVKQHIPLVRKKMEAFGPLNSFDNFVLDKVQELCSLEPFGQNPAVERIAKDFESFFVIPGNEGYVNNFDFERWFKLLAMK